MKKLKNPALIVAGIFLLILWLAPYYYMDYIMGSMWTPWYMPILVALYDFLYGFQRLSVLSLWNIVPIIGLVLLVWGIRGALIRKRH